MPSLLKKIETLREQPKAVRNRFAITVAFFFTFLVAGVWGVAMTAKVASIGRDTADTIVTIPTPSRWWGTLSDLSANFKASALGGLASDESATEASVNTLDIEALSKAPLPATSPLVNTATSTATSSGVWQRQYSNTQGRPIVIATTSNSTTTQQQ